MTRCISLFIFLAIPVFNLFSCTGKRKIYVADSVGHSYFFSSSGSDNNDGTKEKPWQSFIKISSIRLAAGDTIFLQGKDTFTGTLYLTPNTAGKAEMPVVITSYGNGNAVIKAGDSSALTVNQSSYITITNIICKGTGRKDGNTMAGIAINNSSHIKINNSEVSGFQKAGLQVYNCNQTAIDNVYAHDNGFAGIHIIGNGAKDSCTNITVTRCKAENNPGDPSEFHNHSGNGILAGFCKNVVIDHCTATNNGWDMPRIGNGPVGIWCYEADSVVIQHCISYRNKTSKGGEDGGGYDFDGGVTNSVIQYCLSYENQGSAFGIFQYAGASSWHNNTIRFCISENDGNVSAAHANAYIWNSSHDSSQFKSLLFYNNTIYNNTGAAIGYSSESDHSDFRFFNNIFVAADDLVTGSKTDSLDVFLANDWWSLKNGFTARNNHDFHNWITNTNREQLNGKIKGLNSKPPFKKVGSTTLTDANQLAGFDSYKLVGASPVKQAGIDLQSLFGIDIGKEDFNGNPVNKHYIGACNQ